MAKRPFQSETKLASSSCYLHEADPAYSGIQATSPAQAVYDWRSKERVRLIRDRMAIEASARAMMTGAMISYLQKAIGDVEGKDVGLFWPIRGEPDLRLLLPWIEARGGRCCLPVVIEKNHPLVFRRWTHGTPLKKTNWSIVEPAEGDAILPDIVIAPLVGFDPAGYRLGYGGGYFDRTLAAHEKPVTKIGAGFAQQQIRTIYPQAHDVAMDWLVTEEGAATPQP